MVANGRGGIVVTISITPGQLTHNDLKNLMEDNASITLNEECIPNIKASYHTVQSVIESGKVVYGINTGFGRLANQKIDAKNLKALQKNLVISHATGTGDFLPNTIIQLMMVMKINSLARGYSGVSIDLLNFMTKLFNYGVIPRIPAKGSVGASGDLVPLAHLSLPIIGEGDVYFQGQIMPSKKALSQLDLAPFELGPKEGLALLNGMQATNALLFDAVLKADSLFKHAMLTGALSIDGAAGSDAPFSETIHLARGHAEQIQCAKLYRSLLCDSEIRASHLDCSRVQDPYSLRCQPQVMGACLAQIKQVYEKVLKEANGVSDNPIVDAKSNTIVSGGNFHGEILAMAADNLALAISEIGAIAERRIALLIDASLSGLPGFLVEESGINSGFMIAHVTAASCASDNKALAHPHCVDSIPTSANQEDHVSMATNGALRLESMYDNTLTILAIELLAACQALEFRLPLKTSPKLMIIYDKVRELIAPYTTDRFFAPDIEQIKTLIKSGVLIDNFENVLGE